jgi:S-adenosylmethionine:tRNA ribosyltransferase-isomerase
MSLSLADYDFELPPKLIAQQPASPRDSARLLVFNRADGSIADAIFRDIDNFLPQNTTIVVNNTKVDKCRLRFGNMEIFVLESINDKTVQALVRPGPKFKLGRTVELANGIAAEVTAVDEEGIRTLALNCALDDPRLEKFKLTPLPPYIAQNEALADEYQTIYAKQAGSKAAPTAGLHFTPELLQKLRNDHTISEITLDVGLGTFAPLREENIESKHLHEETYSISEPTAKELNAAQHITAVGTTTVRTLESAVTQDGQTARRPEFRRTRGSTEIFIQPGYRFKAVDAMITNFHLPKTSLLMLVAAFMRYEPMMHCYKHAIANEYRFYSFGDAMLIL